MSEEEVGRGQKGPEATVARYAELKEQFHDRGAYDFGSERGLSSLGYEILEKGDFAGAIAVFRLYTEEFPGSSHAWDSLGEAYMKAGDRGQAETSYRRLPELDPDNRNAAEKLKELRARGE